MRTGALPGGWRGVAATGDVAPGDVVLRVPGSLLMSARSRARPRPGGRAGDARWRAQPRRAPELPPATRVVQGRAVALERVREAAPRRYNLLASWTDTEIEALQAPEAIAVAERAAKDMCASHERALPTLKHLGLRFPSDRRARGSGRGARFRREPFSCPSTTPGRFVPWGTSSTTRRPRGLGGRGRDWDAAQQRGARFSVFSERHTRHATHARSVFARVSARVFEPKTESGADARERRGGGRVVRRARRRVRLYARRRYGRGDQIMLCYGAHTNLSLLEHYGFYSLRKRRTGTTPRRSRRFPRSAVTLLKIMSPRLGRTTTTRRRAKTRRVTG